MNTKTNQHQRNASNNKSLDMMVILILSTIAALVLGASSVSAQDAEQPRLDVTGINTVGFPEIDVTIYGENLGVGLAELPVIVREDKASLSPSQSAPIEVGVQTALVLDASNNIRLSGNTGQPRFQEFAQAADQLLASGVLSAQTDWLGAFTTGPTRNEYRTIADWTQDHGGLRNQLFLYTPPDDTQLTPLFDLIEFTLDQFEDSPAATNLNRSIVIFSDGFDATSDLDRNDVIRRATEMRVRIYTVMVGPSGAERRSNLERIAKLTDGTFTFLDTQASLSPIWRSLGQQRTQRLIRYRTTRQQPVGLNIEAQLPGRTPIVRAVDFPVTGAKPVEIQILSPAADGVIEPEAGNLDVQLQYIWPDGLPRQLRRVELSLNDHTEVYEGGAFEQLSFPLAELNAGNYTLRAVAIDEVSTRGESRPVSVVVPGMAAPATAVPTAAPTAVPTQVPTPEPLPEPAPPLWRLVLLPLVALFGFIAYRMWRRRREDEDDSDFFFEPDSQIQATGLEDFTLAPGTVDIDATVLPGPPDFDVEPVANLICLKDSNHLPERIPLYPNGKIRIGRNANTCDIVLDDMSISRSHAFLMEKEDGFHIQDDISTGGTYVNRRPLGVSGDQLLSDGDVINFHEIAYRFELAKDSESSGRFDFGNSVETSANDRGQASPEPSPLPEGDTAYGYASIDDDDGHTEYPDLIDGTEFFVPQTDVVPVTEEIRHC